MPTACATVRPVSWAALTLAGIMMETSATRSWPCNV